MVLAKILPIIDPSLGENFLNEIKTNWDNATPTQMTLDKLQRLVQSVVTSKEKLNGCRFGIFFVRKGDRRFPT
jgi:hypothetical protein